jgi:hypothetical protein
MQDIDISHRNRMIALFNAVEFPIQRIAVACQVLTSPLLESAIFDRVPSERKNSQLS